MRLTILLTGLVLAGLSSAFAQTPAIGPSIGDELQAAGVMGLPFSWNSQTGQVRTDDPRLTAAQRTAILAVFAAHNPATPSAAHKAEQEKVKARQDLITHCANVEADGTQAAKLRELCRLLKQVIP